MRFSCIVFKLYAFKCCKLICQFVTARTNFLAVLPKFQKIDVIFVRIGIFCLNVT